MRITNVCPLGDLDIDAIGLTVPAGATVDVPDVVAGRAPEARVVACEVALVVAVVARDHEVAKACREEWGTLDHGEGLLAQPGNWVPAKTVKAAKAGNEGGSE